MARRKTEAETDNTPEKTADAKQPTHCAVCGAALRGTYIHGGAIVAKSRAAGAMPLLELPEPVAMCHSCAACGLTLTVAVEWRRAE